MSFNRIKTLLICIIAIISFGRCFALEKLHFVTTTDTEHYRWTLNLIAGIHRYHFDQIGTIAVYDIGLTSEQTAFLNSLAYVTVHSVERTNPYIFQKFAVNNKGKVSRGWYSWKPVVIKQAMEMQPEFFYLDSGITLRGSIDLLFQQVRDQGYFFIDCGHSIERMTPKPLVDKFNLDSPSNRWILSEKGISAGFQGLSKAIYRSYVLPVYELSKDIANFMDDGSCPKGFGWARHDQTVFSIQARLLGLKVNDVIRGGSLKLKNNGKIVKARLEDFIEITRADFDLNKSQTYLKFKTETPK